MPKWILVAGSAWASDKEAIWRAQLIGRALARAGLGLVVGSWPGVDAAAAESFLSELAILGKDAGTLFRQFRDPYWRRRSAFLLRHLPRYHGPPESTIKLRNTKEVNNTAVAMCDAGIMIGGYGGTLRVARAMIAAGKPVFPIPFSGGQSDHNYQELLKTWNDNPIPGLTRDQVLRLALPWVGDASRVVELIKGTLAQTPDVFISYRRSDSASAVGRLQHDLGEYFGSRRIFVDETRIEPSAIWRQSIESALQNCKVGLIVIGRNWLNDRLHDQTNTLHWEVATLLESKVALPLLVDDAGLPASNSLPEPLKRLRDIQARSISNATWPVTVNELIRTIESILKRA